MIKAERLKHLFNLKKVTIGTKSKRIIILVEL